MGNVRRRDVPNPTCMRDLHRGARISAAETLVDRTAISPNGLSQIVWALISSQYRCISSALVDWKRRERCRSPCRLSTSHARPAVGVAVSDKLDMEIWCGLRPEIPSSRCTASEAL
jgi:hypothetical protein